MSENGTCPIWGTPTRSDEFFSGDGINVDSPRAGGRYFLDGRAVILVRNLEAREKTLLTTWMVEQRKLGIERPRVLSYSNYIESITQRPDLTVHARADRLLKYISIKIPSSNIGEKYTIWHSPEEYLDRWEMLAYTESTTYENVLYLLDYLVRKHWLSVPLPGADMANYAVTVEGYARLADLEREVTDSSRAFVAMWFDDAVDDAWTQGIKPAIENTGYNPVRIDSQDFIGKIDDRIIAEIRRSRFVVADFTQGIDGARGGVYYEAGFAHGLDIPVIFTCRSDSIDNVHFDTRQYNHIVWDSPESLKERLENRIAAEIGDGPLKN